MQRIIRSVTRFNCAPLQDSTNRFDGDGVFQPNKIGTAAAQ